MDALSKEYVNSFFSGLFRMHGDRPEALRWTTDGQRMRYDILLDIAKDLGGKRILDYGCGKGDFYSYLKGKGISVQYTGVDINPDLISFARAKHPECRFELMDIEDTDISGEFDYAFACGVFNYRIQGATQSMFNAMERMFAHVKEGIAITAISAHSTQEDIDINYISPEAVFKHAVRHITRYACLRHDYIPYDFTLYLYKRPRNSLISA